jgi:hypothetical protein
LTRQAKLKYVFGRNKQKIKGKMQILPPRQTPYYCII